MSVARVGTIGTNTGGASSGTVASNASTVTGNLLILCVNSGSTVLSITGGANGVWTQFGSTISTSNANTQLQFWTKIAEAGDNGGATYTVTLNASTQFNLSMDTWSGNAGLRLRGFQATISNTAATATISTPLNLCTANEGIIVIGGCNTFVGSPTNTTTGAGYTERSDLVNATLIATAVSTAVGAISNVACTCTWTANSTSRAIAAAVVTDNSTPVVVNIVGAVGSANPAVFAYPMNVQAGDALVFCGVAQGSISPDPPTGWTAVGTPISIAGLSLQWYVKIAAGTESGTNLSVPFGSANNWMFSIHHVTYPTPITLSWITRFQSSSQASAGTSYAAPNMGALSATDVGFTAVGAYNTAASGGQSVSGAGWAISVSQNQGGSPNIGATIVGISSSATGACTAAFTGTYAAFAAAVFALSPPNPGGLLLASL